MSFPKYPEYKESGLSSVGEIPSHWTPTRLKWVVEPKRPITYGIVQAGPEIPEGIPYIRPADMTDESGVADFESMLRTSEEIALAYTRSSIHQGDLVCSIGPSFGKVMVTPPELEGANLTQGTARVAISSVNSPRFFFWCLRSAIAYNQWEASVGGATFRALNLGPLAATDLPCPPEHEQSAIAAFLDRETAKIDALVTEQEKLIELLKEKRQAVISHAVTKGLDTNVPMKDSGVEWLGEVPEHWDVMQLKHVIAPDTVITYGIVQAGPHVDDGIPYIKTSDMSGEKLPSDGYARTSSEIDKSYSRSKVRSGDIVVAIRATVGKCLPVPPELEGANLTQGTAKVSPGPLVDRIYLLHALNASASQFYFDFMAKGATFREITLDALRRTPITLPPIEDQNQIILFLDRELRCFDSLQEEAQRAIDLLKERRVALISAAVAGKIDVREKI